MRYFIKLTVFYFLVLSVLLPGSAKLAQFQEGDKKQEEGYYSQLVRAVIRLEEHRSICTPGRDSAIERDVPVGTPFFIRDRLPAEGTKEINRFFLEQPSGLGRNMRQSGERQDWGEKVVAGED